MDAAVPPPRSHLHSRGLRRAATLALGSLVATAVMAGSGCGTNVSTPLPDMATTRKPQDGSQPTLTTAQQKQAIDNLIAKRDAQGQGQTQGQTR